jgi:hypothetical protein
MIIMLSFSELDISEQNIWTQIKSMFRTGLVGDMFLASKKKVYWSEELSEAEWVQYKPALIIK